MFKTFKYKNPKKGRYASIKSGEIFECGIPELLPLTCTLKDLKEYFPAFNFEDVELITVTVTEIKNN